MAQDARIPFVEAYLARNWRVFVLSETKVPIGNCADCNAAGSGHDAESCSCLLCHGFYAATTDPERIARMLYECPRGQLAVRTGAASGIIALDFEGSKKSSSAEGSVSGTETLEQWESWAGFSLAETLTATTPSGGCHLFYALPGERSWKSQNRVLPGMDIKCEFGYVAVPSGDTDRVWLNASFPPVLVSEDLSSWLSKTLTRSRVGAGGSGGGGGGGGAGHATGYDYQKFVAEGCPDGFRDEFFNDMAFRLRKAGATEEEAEIEIRKHWERVPQPPKARYYMPLSDALRKIVYVWRSVEPLPPTPSWEMLSETGRKEGENAVISRAHGDPAVLRDISGRLKLGGALSEIQAASLGVSAPGMVGAQIRADALDSPKEDPAETGQGRFGKDDKDGAGEDGIDPPIIGEVFIARERPAEPTSDTGNAYRFVRLCGEDVRYVPEWGRWLVWGGNRWVPDKLNVALRLTKTVAEDIRRQALVTQDSDEAQIWARWALASDSLARRKAILELAGAEEELALDVSQLNADPMVLVVKNGVLDLRTQTLAPARREDYCTYSAGVAFDPAAECPRWRDHVNFLCRGDQTLIAYIQRAFGYTLTGLVKDQVFFSLEGTGGNGKNALIEPIVALLGDYAQTGTSALLTGGDEQHPTILADLLGARMVFVDEARKGAQVNVERVKQLTGSKHVKARRIGKDFFEFPAQLKLWIAGNAPLSLKDPSDGTWRRLQRLIFDVKVPPGRKIPDYGQLLFDEEGSGILNWALEGLRSYLELGQLARPEIVEDSVAALRADEDTIGLWLAEEVESTGDVDHRVTVNDLYVSYRVWALREGVKDKDIPERRHFGRQLSQRGLNAFVGRVAGKVSRGYQGVRLIQSVS